MSVSSDDEYAPIEATTWGSQTPLQADNQSEVAIEAKGWDSLLDPSVKEGPNNLGSGNLHRKGTNFKPIGEDLILAQRLNKPVGKKKMQDAIRETEANLGLPQGKDRKQRSKKKPQVDTSVSNSRKFSHQTTFSSSTTTTTTNRQPKPMNHVEVPSTTRVPKFSENAVDGGGSKWLQSSLVDTPFWNEKKGEENASKPYNNSMLSPPQPPPPSQSNNAAASWNTATIPASNHENSSSQPSIANGRNAIHNKYKAEISNNNVWSKSADKSEKEMKDGWGAIAKDIEPFTNTGWDVEENKSEISKNNVANTDQWNIGPSTTSTTADFENKDEGWASGFGNGANLSGWESSSNGGWGQPVNEAVSDTLPSSTPSWMNSGNNTNAVNDYNNIPPSKPSWMNSSSTSHDNYNNSPNPESGGRFSNPSKQRYSGSLPMNLPRPLNYRPQSSQLAPLATAPPPPPENNLLVKINVELSDTLKISVDIHELDEPLQLAKTFAENNNIQNEKVVAALTQLFTKQKAAAVEKKKHKLQRKVPSSYSKPRYYNNNNNIQNNAYTNTSSYQYPSAPATPATSPPPPFTRKAYY